MNAEPQTSRLRPPAAYIAGMTFFAIVIVISALVFVFVPDSPRSASALCDRLFAEFMAASDVAEIERDGVLLSRMGCDLTRRYRKFVQQEKEK